MKANATVAISVITFLIALMISVQLTAQERTEQNHTKHHRYRFIDLGTLGGSVNRIFFGGYRQSQVQVINNRGTLAGWSTTTTPDPFPDFCWEADCLVAHTYQTRNGVLKDLGALPGGGSSDSRWISANGLIVGESENGQLDPLNSGFPQIHAVFWKHGAISDLGTLDGGYQSSAHAVNSAGQAVGYSLNTIPDPNSMFGSFFGIGYQQTRAFLWQNGVMQDLGTLGTGTNAIALLINERGQIAGDSYTSSDPSPSCSYDFTVFPLTTGGFLWEKGKMTDLGGFGGTCTVVTGLNNQGQVIGISNLAGDQSYHPYLWDPHTRRHLRDLGTLGGTLGTAEAMNDAGDVVGNADLTGDLVTHATLWRRGGRTDLGTVGTDQCSIGFSINSSVQVVGISSPDCSFEEANGFLWERGGPMIDLNDFVPPDSDLHLRAGATINDRGEIAASGLRTNGFVGSALLLPCDDEPADSEGCRGGKHDSVNPGARTTSSIQSKLGPREVPRRSSVGAASRYHTSDPATEPKL
jgi:probable HAF family extracellular repeat protein